jgi:hypothetical protein
MRLWDILNMGRVSIKIIWTPTIIVTTIIIYIIIIIIKGIHS